MSAAQAGTGGQRQRSRLRSGQTEGGGETGGRTARLGHPAALECRSPRTPTATHPSFKCCRHRQPDGTATSDLLPPPIVAGLTDLGVAAAVAARSQSLWPLSRLQRGKSMQLREADGCALTSAAEDRTAEWTRRRTDRQTAASGGSARFFRCLRPNGSQTRAKLFV